MRLIDFEYDGIKLSEKNMMLCNFGSPSDDVDFGNELDWNLVKAAKGDTYYSPAALYSKPFTTTLSICPDYCKDFDRLDMTDKEINEIMTWLNRRTFCKFKPIYNDGEFSDIYYMATFNLTGVYGRGGLIGFEMEMQTNAPYAMREQISVQSDSLPFSLDNISDEIGYLYPTFEITLQQSGDLELTNSLDPKHVTIIKNCEVGETITFSGKSKQIKSSYGGHTTLANDYNYHPPRLVRTRDKQLNEFDSNLTATVRITYNPIAKVGMIV